MTEAEAYAFTVDYLRRGIVSPSSRDPRADLNTNAVDIHQLIYSYIERHEQQNMQRSDGRAQEISPLFLSAVWELCILGVLRPGPPNIGFAGSGVTTYSVTESGKR